jgi:hypothetical protein
MPDVVTIKRLYALSGNQCAFPECQQPLVVNDVQVGEMCHIKGAKPGAARYDLMQTEHERNAFENLIVLCATHHTLVDKDPNTYKVKDLREMKFVHERRQLPKFEISDALATKIAMGMGGGVAVGMVLAELMHKVGPLIGGIFNSSPGLPKNMDKVQDLRSKAPGAFAVHAPHPISIRTQRRIFSMLRMCNWKPVTFDFGAVRKLDAPVSVMLRHGDEEVLQMAWSFLVNEDFSERVALFEDSFPLENQIYFFGPGPN